MSSAPSPVYEQVVQLVERLSPTEKTHLIEHLQVEPPQQPQSQHPNNLSSEE